ncbi:MULTISPECIES: hypothetical protein [unclassified Helicobacter]|uniref:hypothetical protein n=1 Tax=unclassified Helicobacter TaxID=2593540 RepID=UPI0015F16342|nr:MULTISPECIES: hypothetical protein [unclassified Helicobacter]
MKLLIASIVLFATLGVAKATIQSEKATCPYTKDMNAKKAFVVGFQQKIGQCR